MGSTYGFEARYISASPLLMRPFSVVGNYGVDLFFVISGFIMTVTTWKLFGSRQESAKFLLRRVLRIYPAYWLLLAPLIGLYILKPGLIDSHARTPPNILDSILLLPQATPLLLVSWSLVFEMAFYSVFAVALCFRRDVLPIVLAVWLAGIAAAALYWGGSSGVLPQFLASPLPVEFFFGIAAGTFVMHGLLRYAVFAAIAAMSFISGAMYLGVAGGEADFPNIWIRVLLAGVGFSLLLYSLVVFEKRYGFTLPKALDRLGDASYALYLWHLPILTALGLLLVRLHIHGIFGHVVSIAIAYASVIGCALFVFRFVERPLTKTLQRKFLPLPSAGVLEASASTPAVFSHAAESRPITLKKKPANT